MINSTEMLENEIAPTISGADIIVETLHREGVDICFANPGTSEMHLVAAFDKIENIRSVLCLFEGVVTGAADGYARITGKPAATLLHLGAGFANSIANIHNAQKANSPMVNIVGQHAISHLEYETPLSSDIEGLARPVSGWVKTIREIQDINMLTEKAVLNTHNAFGRISTLIVPSDMAWSKINGNSYKSYKKGEIKSYVDKDLIKHIACILSSSKDAVIFINTTALDKDCVDLLGKIQKKTNCRIFSELFVSRITKGAGEVIVERIPFRQAEALKMFAGVDEAILVGAHHPRTFFAYPDQDNSSMFMPHCRVTQLTGPDKFSYESLSELVSELDAENLTPDVSPSKNLETGSGELTTEKVGQSIAALLPENTIISDDGITSTFNYWPLFKHAPKHDWLYTTGGAIGQGLPVAIGAALGAAERKVICLSGDGSAMYTIQSLWTQVRENLNITNIIYSNRSYKILNSELSMVGIKNLGVTGKNLLDLSKPDIDFVKMAESVGMQAACVSTMDEFNHAFEKSISANEPRLIEVIC